jgi:hypothetical protein
MGAQAVGAGVAAMSRRRLDWTATALLAAVVVLLACMVALLVLDRFWVVERAQEVRGE